MTEAEARARIISFCDAEREPVLSSADVDILVAISKSADKYGLLPTDTGWTPTWNINYATAQGWLLKATKLPDRYLFMSGGKMFSRNQFFEHCMVLYRRFLGKSGIRGIRLYPDVLPYDPPVPNNWNYG